MSVKSKIQSLIAAANAKTGESDATLTDAVQTLCDGYGQGGGSGGATWAEITVASSKDNANEVANMLSASVPGQIYPAYFRFTGDKASRGEGRDSRGFRAMAASYMPSSSTDANFSAIARFRNSAVNDISYEWKLVQASIICYINAGDVVEVTTDELF